MSDYILCVDDEAIILLAMKQELKRRFRDRFFYETAEDAEDALEIAREIKENGDRIAVVITDWLMPKMKGDELIDRLKLIYPDISSILMTGFAEEVSEAKTENRLESCFILRKPWRSEELNRIVENFLSS